MFIYFIRIESVHHIIDSASSLVIHANLSKQLNIRVSKYDRIHFKGKRSKGETFPEDTMLKQHIIRLKRKTNKEKFPGKASSIMKIT